MISRSDYEIWIIDWLDGNLTEAQSDELFTFLESNPGIRAEMSDLLELKPKKKENKYYFKSSLKRSVSEITDSQFDLLCVAHLEHDLSPRQEKELEEIIRLVPGKKEILHSFGRTKLTPSGYTYPGKKSLKKRTAIQRSLVQIMGAAASIALLVAVYLLSSRRFSDQKTAQEIVSVPVIIYSVPPYNSTQGVERVNISQKVVFKGRADENMIIEPAPAGSTDLTAGIKNENLSEPSYVPVSFYPALNGSENIISGIHSFGEEELISYDPGLIVTDPYDDRGRVERFLTMAYRSVLLHEKDNNLPLNRYEFAKGGISGINRLFGWEMAIQPSNDEYGNIESYYFSSKILKFSMPLKKTDSNR